MLHKPAHPVRCSSKAANAAYPGDSIRKYKAPRVNKAVQHLMEAWVWQDHVKVDHLVHFVLWTHQRFAAIGSDSTRRDVPNSASSIPISTSHHATFHAAARTCNAALTIVLHKA